MIVEPFTDTRGVEHGSAKFEALVKGSPTPKIRVLLDGVPFEPDWRAKTEEKVEGDGETVKLVFSKLMIDDEGEYTLIATNEAGKAKCKAFLTVAPGGAKHVTKVQPGEVTIPPCISEKLQDSVSFFTEFHFMQIAPIDFFFKEIPLLDCNSCAKFSTTCVPGIMS